MYQVVTSSIYILLMYQWCRTRCRSWCRGSCCRPSRRSSGSWSPNLRRRLPTTPSRRSSLAWSPSRSKKIRRIPSTAGVEVVEASHILWNSTVGIFAYVDAPAYQILKNLSYY